MPGLMSSDAAILQTQLPVRPWLSAQGRRLPGLSPIAPRDWLLRDEVFSAQMTYRDHLIGETLQSVYAEQPVCRQSSEELLSLIVETLSETPGYRISEQTALRPDGVEVRLGDAPALITAGRLVQEDLLILHKAGNTHHLVGGLVCFPALWRLNEKLGRSLLGVHAPVAEYSEPLASRIERVLSSIRPDQALMRANVLIYENPELHQPATEGTAKVMHPNGPRYVRVERQTFRRLPRTGAVIFAIHTSIVPADSLPEDEHTALAELRPELVKG